MTSSLRGALALFVVIASTSALAATPPAPQTDAKGRVVRDANGRKQNYGPGSDASAAKMVVPRAAAAKATGGTRLNAAAPATTYEENWRFNTWGYGIGSSGFWPVDVDANGDKEIVYGLGGKWAIADYFPETREYRVLWKSPFLDVSALRVVEVGSTKSVWVASHGDGIRVYNALTHALVATLPVASNVSVIGLDLADGNNDGSIDVIALAQDRLLFFDPVTLQPRPTVIFGANTSAQGFAVGNVDDDPAREIVLSDGHVITVTGSTYTVDWNKGSAFGGFYNGPLRLADIDADGRDELIASQGWYSIQAWDLELHAVKWQHQTDLDIAAVRTFDVTGDGVPEVIYGDGQWGEIHAIDGASNSELWHAPNPEHGVTDVAIFDADGDGVLELLWGAGASSTGPDYMYVVNVANRALEWRSFDINDDFRGLDVGDLDNDGRPELVVASYESESGYAGGALLIFDAVTHALEYRSETSIFGGESLGDVLALRIGNVDADPQPEIVIAGPSPYDGRLVVVDGLTHAIEHTWNFGFGEPLSEVFLADVNGDGQNDVLSGNTRAHSGATGDYLHAIDPRTGAIIWKSQALGAYVYNVQATDVGAPGLDVVATAGNVLRVRWSDKQQTMSVDNSYVTLVPLDVTGSTALELVAGRTDGSIDVLDGESLLVLSSHPGACVGAGMYSMIAHGPRSVAFRCGDDIVIYDLGTSSVTANIDTGMNWSGGALVRYIAAGKSAFFAGGQWPAVFLDIGGNSVPTLAPTSASLHWRSSTDLTIAGSDIDNDALTYQISRLPALGAASWLNAAGGLRYTAAGAAKGTDTMLLRAYDGFQFSTPQTVTLTLTNTVPAATTTTLSLHWRGAQTARLVGNDANGDPFTFALGAAPTRGTLALVNAANGDVRFEPSGAFVGGDSFTYTVSDGADVSAARTVAVTLTNTAPTAVNPTYAITIGNTVAGRVSGTDANGDPLTYAVLASPSRGTFTLDAATGLFEYVPLAGNGDVTLQVAVRDGVSESAPVTVTFDYPAPAASSSGGGRGGGGGGSLDLLILAALAWAAARRLLGRRG